MFESLLDFGAISTGLWSWHTLVLYFWATLNTILIAAAAILIGFMLWLSAGLARVSKRWYLRYPASAYVNVIRGTPLLVQLFLWYFGLAIVTSGTVIIEPILAAIIAVGVHSGAYQAEIVRGGINSIPKGQAEAARAAGMTEMQSMRYVILPQAMRLVLPPLGNEFVIVIKDSSLGYAISVAEITFVSSQLNGRYFEPFQIFLFAAFLYFCLTFVTGQLMKGMEHRYRIPGYGEHE